MIGVVVWSSEDRQKAVIWCEDHGALAYLQGRADLAGDQMWPDAGDLLELESETIGALRHARNVSILSDRRCAQLPEMLRAQITPEPKLRLVPDVGQPSTANEPRETKSAGRNWRPVRITAAG